MIGFLDSKGFELKKTFEDVHNKTAWVAELVTVAIVIHFWNQIKNQPAPFEFKSMQRFVQLSITSFAVIAVTSSFMVGYKLLHETPSKVPIERLADFKDKAIAQTFEARMYVNSKGDTLFYRLKRPLNYQPGTKYPIVVCLHGGAGWGTDNIKQVQGSLPAVMLSNYLIREQHPAFLFVPQISGAYSFGGVPNLEVIDTLVFDAMQSLEKEFNIDEKRRYVSGNSLGGYGTWHFIGTRPDLFAAGIPISGEGNPELANNMTQVAVWAFHGAKDVNVPVSGSRDAINAMKKVGGSPRYTEYPDNDHDIWMKVVGTPDLVEWLFAQKKESR